MPAIFEKIDRIKPFYDLTYKVVLFVCKVLLVIDIAIQVWRLRAVTYRLYRIRPGARRSF